MRRRRPERPGQRGCSGRGGLPPLALAMPPPLLQVRDLRVEFRTERGALRAVDDVSLELGAGRTLGIVGESGCGKTVFSRSLLRLNPIAGGQVLLDGQDLAAMDEG